jgi:hypothetical protein
MADRSAIASGFSLSDMGKDGGCCLNVAVGGGTTRGRASVFGTGASCAIVAVGVIGDTGGLLGEVDAERFPERSEVVEASLDEAGRVLVSTKSAGMAVWWEDVSRRSAGESWRFGDRRRRRCGGQDRSRRGLRANLRGSSPLWWRRLGAI